ncbi:hypothetical protein HY634_04320 [Candidatus Uhrbacteria bacterium]|nr:hypothetical protein [Candidatus Uhrbacteria bacterium]
MNGLRAVVVPSAEEGDAFDVGDTGELLGFFSVNLRTAMDSSTSAKKKSSAVPVPGALEFFVFGRAKDVPVRNAKCQPDTSD